MSRNTGIALLSAAAVMLSSCGYDNGTGCCFVYGPPPGPQALLEVLHASPDAPKFTVLLDGSPLYTDLDYAQGTGQMYVDATTSHTVAIQAQTPGAPTTVIGPLTESLTVNTVYTVVAEGPVASVGPMLFSHPQTAIGSSATRVQVVHAAPAAPSVAVYLTAPGADLASSTPLGTVSYQGSIGPTDVPSGQYEIRMTPAGVTTPVLFDSGTVNLLAGADLLLAAVQNTGTGSAPVALAAVDQFGNNSLVFDIATPAGVRFVHDVANAPAISVLANGNAAAPLVASLAYPNFTAYLPEAPAVYNISVTAATNTGTALLTQAVDLDAGYQYTFYAVGPLASINDLVTRDGNRRIATQAELRIIHGSPSAGPVDVYIAPTGTSIAALAPTYANLPFGWDTGHQGFVAGNYNVTITAAGSKTPAIGPVTVTLKNSGVYTAVARDAAGGGTPLGLILLDDTAP